MSQEAHAVSARIFSLDFVRSYVITMRPYLLFISGITGIVGLSFAPPIPTGTLAILAVAFFLSYGFGQALTDCFQTDTDSLSSPYRPLSQGRVRRGNVLAVSLTGLFAIGIILTVAALINLVLSTVAVIGLATYTYFKRRWWGGPWYNAWIVALLYLIAFVSGSGVASAAVAWNPPVLFTLVGVFFGYANFVLSGYFKDISADRATGYNTLPVVFGLKVSAVVSDVFAFLTLISCAAAIYTLSPSENAFPLNSYSLVVYVAGAATSVFAQLRLHIVYSEKDAHRAIAPVVHAYLLLLSAIAVAQRPDWAIALIVFYAGFIVTMKFRPMAAQI
ncbi:MAG: UbiA family prenyltransferase [Bacteroidota bacterium]